LLELEGNDNDNAIEHPPVRLDSINKEVESTNPSNATTGSIKIPSTFLEPPPSELSIHLGDERTSSQDSETITNQTTTIPPTSDDESSIKNVEVNQTTTNAPAEEEGISSLGISGSAESTTELPTTISEQLKKDDSLHSSPGEVISVPLDDETINENKEVLTTPISEDLALSSSSNEKNNDQTVFLTTPSTESTMDFENDDTFSTEEPQEFRIPLEHEILKNSSTYTDSTTTDSIPLSSTIQTEDETSSLTSEILLKEVPISSEINHALNHDLATATSISTELPKLEEETTSQPEDIKPGNSTEHRANTELKEPILNDGIISSVGNSQELGGTKVASESLFPNSNVGLKEILSTLSDSHESDEASSEEESTESSTIIPTTNLPEDEQATAILSTGPSEGKETQTETTTHDHTDLTTSLLNLDELTSTPFPETTIEEIIPKYSEGSLKVSTSASVDSSLIDTSSTIPPKTIVIKEQDVTSNAPVASSVGHVPLINIEGSIADSTTSSSLHVSEHKENSTKKHVISI